MIAHGVRDLLKRSESLVRIVRRVRRRFRQRLGRMTRGRRIDRYLKEHPVPKLHLGAGRNLLPGWLNTDFEPRQKGVVYVDALDPLPLADGSFRYVFSEHLIEHLDFRAGQRFLRECHRVLAPGGCIRIATPDLKALFGLLAPGLLPMQDRYAKWIIDNFIPYAFRYEPSFVINNAMRNYGHKFLYDEETLVRALEAAGFVSVTRCQPGESADPFLHGIECHGRDIHDEEINRFETMVFEASR